MQAPTKKRARLDAIEFEGTKMRRPIQPTREEFPRNIKLPLHGRSVEGEKDGRSCTSSKLCLCIPDGRHLPNGAKTTINTMKRCMPLEHAHKISRMKISMHRIGKMKECRTIFGMVDHDGARCPLEDQMRRGYDILVTADT